MANRVSELCKNHEELIAKLQTAYEFNTDLYSVNQAVMKSIVVLMLDFDD